MRKKYLFIIIILLLITILFYLIFFDTTDKRNFNTDLKLSTTLNELSSNIQSISSDYEMKDRGIVEIDSETEKKVIEVALNMSKAINDIENEDYTDNVYKYFIRERSLSLSESSDFFGSVWNDEYEATFLKLSVWLDIIRGRSITYKEILDYNISYASSKRFLVQVYVSDVNLTYGVNNVRGDGIYEYEIVYEESSGLYKVRTVNLTLVKDIDDYYREMDEEERKQNKENSSTFSNVTSYVPKGYTTFDYSKLEKVSSETTKAIYEKNKNSIVIIDSVSEEGITTGSASGFFIKSGIIMTSYSNFYSMLKNGAKRYYAIDDNDNIHNISGVVAAYPGLNIVILKLEEEFGKEVEIGSSEQLEENDPIVVISSSLGLKSSIKMGIYFDTLNDDYKIIRTSLPLIAGDGGSAIFNLEGQIIAINTDVSISNTNYNSGLNNATDIAVMEEVINKIRKDSFNDIKSKSFDEINYKKINPVVNKVKDSIWQNYLKLPIITNYFPINLYSSYEKDNYLIVRYKQENQSLIDNQAIITSYKNYLVENKYTMIDKNLFQKDKVKIWVKENLGFIVIIVEGIN